MSGPLSANAPFTTFGQTMILRDIEQLYLLIGNRNGDLGDAGYSTKRDGDLGDNSASGGGGAVPDGFSIVTITVCVGGVSKSLDVLGRGPY